MKDDKCRRIMWKTEIKSFLLNYISFLPKLCWKDNETENKNASGSSFVCVFCFQSLKIWFLWVMTQNLRCWEQKTHVKLKPKIDKIEIWKCFYVVIFDFELWHPTVRIIGGERHPPLNSRFSLRHKTAFLKEFVRWLLILHFHSHF